MRIYKNFEDKKKTRGAGKYLKWYFAATCNDMKMSISEKEDHQLKFENFLLTKKAPEHIGVNFRFQMT